MRPPERPLPELRRLLAEQAYFVVRAPPQTGKTTTFRTLAAELVAEGQFAAVHVTCEAPGAASADIKTGIDRLLSSLDREARRALPPDLRPPDPAGVAGVPALDRLTELLWRWSRQAALPVVLFLDHIDALHADTLRSVICQLRAGHSQRPTDFPIAIGLIGLHDVREFNIKVESLTLRPFTFDEIAELYDQHHAATGQAFLAEAMDLALELTRGQPWLVNALAENAVQATPAGKPIDRAAISNAKNDLMALRNSHFDSLVERLRNPRVRRIIEPILTGNMLSAAVTYDDIAIVRNIGLVEDHGRGLEIANPIYLEVILGALSEADA